MGLNITRGTTPLCNMCLVDNSGRNIDLSAYDTVVLTVSDGTHKIDVPKASMTFNDDRTISCYLTEQDTLQLQGYEVEVQLRAKKNDSEGNMSIASDIATVQLQQILKEGAL